METAPTSIFSERPIATAITVGIATLIPHLFLPPALSLALAAIVMGMVAGVYFGFAVMRGDNFQQQIEFNVSLLFIVAALLGVWVSPWLISGGILGAWSVGFRPSQQRQFAPRLHSTMVHSVVRGHRCHSRHRVYCAVASERTAVERSRVSTRQVPHAMI